MCLCLHVALLWCMLACFCFEFVPRPRLTTDHSVFSFPKLNGLVKCTNWITAKISKIMYWDQNSRLKSFRRCCSMAAVLWQIICKRHANARASDSFVLFVFQRSNIWKKNFIWDAFQVWEIKALVRYNKLAKHFQEIIYPINIWRQMKFSRQTREISFPA